MLIKKNIHPFYSLYSFEKNPIENPLSVLSQASKGHIKESHIIERFSRNKQPIFQPSEDQQQTLPPVRSAAALTKKRLNADEMVKSNYHYHHHHHHLPAKQPEPRKTLSILLGGMRVQSEGK